MSRLGMDFNSARFHDSSTPNITGRGQKSSAARRTFRHTSSSTSSTPSVSVSKKSSRSCDPFRPSMATCFENCRHSGEVSEKNGHREPMGTRDVDGLVRLEGWYSTGHRKALRCVKCLTHSFAPIRVVDSSNPIVHGMDQIIEVYSHRR